GTLGVRTGAWQLGGPRDDTPALFDRLGFGDRLRRLTAEETRRIADSPRFLAGTFNRDGAVVQPARLARGLRRVLLERGVRIFERTRVLGVDRTRRPLVRTDHGAVRSDQVVLTHGAWAAGWRDFARSFSVIVDYGVATDPIPDML